MPAKSTMALLENGVSYLDEILGGGLPKTSVTVIGGPPGSGKTILAKQIGFHHAAKQTKVLLVESHLLRIHELIVARDIRRVAIDSLSAFLHKVWGLRRVREKICQLATIVQNTDAVGPFSAEAPASHNNPANAYGVETTIVDGVILLDSVRDNMERLRSIEVYKRRNTAHAKGAKPMLIGRHGLAAALPGQKGET